MKVSDKLYTMGSNRKSERQRFSLITFEVMPSRLCDSRWIIGNMINRGY